jgi:hypothetical protein
MEWTAWTKWTGLDEHEHRDSHKKTQQTQKERGKQGRPELGKRRKRENLRGKGGGGKTSAPQDGKVGVQGGRQARPHDEKDYTKASGIWQFPERHLAGLSEQQNAGG